MGVELLHPQYETYQDKWQRCRDCFEGEDEVKDRGTTYLPQLSGQDDDDYSAYKKRALYYSVISRTIQGMVGSSTRIPPVVNVPDKMRPWLQDITNTGISLNGFIQQMIEEHLLMSRYAILVDHDGDRPYLTGYTAESIRNWSNSSVVLGETVQQVAPDDVYDIEEITQLRELIATEEGYQVNLWQEDYGWEIVEKIQPTLRGTAIEGIPLVVLSKEGVGLNISSPSSINLVNMSLSHYRTSADLEHGRHYTALPTPYVTGIDVDTELRIGAGTAWVLPDVQSKAGYLEFSGQGLRALETALDDKRRMMATLGAQMLEQSREGVEAAETVRLRQNAETSTVIQSLNIVEQGITQALKKMAEWQGIDSEGISVEINKDIIDAKMSSKDLTALVGAWQNGVISQEAATWNIKKGELLPPDSTGEEEIVRLKERATVSPGKPNDAD